MFKTWEFQPRFDGFFGAQCEEKCLLDLPVTTGPYEPPVAVSSPQPVAQSALQPAPPSGYSPATRSVFEQSLAAPRYGPDTYGYEIPTRTYEAPTSGYGRVARSPSPTPISRVPGPATQPAYHVAPSEYDSNAYGYGFPTPTYVAPRTGYGRAVSPPRSPSPTPLPSVPEPAIRPEYTKASSEYSSDTHGYKSPPLGHGGVALPRRSPSPMPLSRTSGPATRPQPRSAFQPLHIVPAQQIPAGRAVSTPTTAPSVDAARATMQRLSLRKGKKVAQGHVEPDPISSIHRAILEDMERPSDQPQTLPVSPTVPRSGEKGQQATTQVETSTTARASTSATPAGEVKKGGETKAQKPSNEWTTVENQKKRPKPRKERTPSPPSTARKQPTFANVASQPAHLAGRPLPQTSKPPGFVEAPRPLSIPISSTQNKTKAQELREKIETEWIFEGLHYWTVWVPNLPRDFKLREHFLDNGIDCCYNTAFTPNAQCDGCKKVGHTTIQCHKIVKEYKEVATEQHLSSLPVKKRRSKHSERPNQSHKRQRWR
ncbi:MAG: hypothetical protein Q9160_004150 [Pyrenula sp. 1 TL-2023]